MHWLKGEDSRVGDGAESDYEWKVATMRSLFFFFSLSLWSLLHAPHYSPRAAAVHAGVADVLEGEEWE